MEGIKAFFSGLNDILLKMTWLSDGFRRLVEDVFGLSVEARIGGSIHFFLYDTVKIFLLLSALIFTVSYIQSFFPPKRTRAILGRFNGVGANLWVRCSERSHPFAPALPFPCSSDSRARDCRSESRSRF
jgi:hypothetical protein